MDPDDRMFMNYGRPPSFFKLVDRNDVAGLRRWMRRISLLTLRQRDSQGKTIFHIAAHQGNVEALRMLLDTLVSRVKPRRGSGSGGVQKEINVKSHYGLTPLQEAVSMSQFAAALVLLEFGAQPSLCMEKAQEDELSLLFQHFISQMQSAHPPSDEAMRLLTQLHAAKARPDVLLRPGVTSMVVLLMEALEREVVETPAFNELLEHVLHMWPDLQLRNDTILLQVALRKRSVFHRMWRYFKEHRQLTLENVNGQVAQGHTVLMESVLQADEATTLTILQESANPLRWQHVPLREVPKPVTPEPVIECDGGCPDDEGELACVDDGEEEGEEEDDEEEVEPLDQAVPPTADMLCPLAAAMRRQQTEVVWRMLEVRPEVWDAKWAQLVECCRRSGSIAWLCRVVCRQARRRTTRRRRRLRMPPLSGAYFLSASLGFAPTTVMDIAMKMMVTQRGRQVDTGLPMSPAYMRRHAALLFRSYGRRETRPSWALVDVLSSCPASQARELSPLLRLVRHRLRPDASLTLFRACLHSRALLMAALGRGARPEVDWGDVSTGSPVLLELRNAVLESDEPRFLWAIVSILLRCHPLLICMGPKMERTPFPLMWQAIGAVRARLEAEGHRTEEQMEEALEALGAAPVTVDLVLMRDVSINLLIHRE